MLQEFLYEIITFIIVVTLLIIYIYIKSQQSTNRTSKSTAVKKETDEKIDKQDDLHAHKPTLLDRSGTDNARIQKSTQKSRKKRSVPEHDKILKENFKEFKGVKILVAEDNHINQKVISGLLSTSGIEVTMADDGQIALDILKQNSDFDLILMDANMPNVDGFEATKKIRSNPKYENIAVIALSGDTAPDDVAKMKKAGMEDHLEKPLRMDAFYDILYAYTNIASNKHDYIEVVMTKELNGDKGLSVCGGDEKFYKSILNEFVTTYSDSYNKIHTLLENSDFEKADSLLLDILGITANIGADNINRIVSELKDSINDTDEKSYFTTLDEYNAHLKYLLKDINNYLAS